MATLATACLSPALSQPLSGVLPKGIIAQPKPGAQMLLEADQLVYDYDHDQVAAVGNVQIYYGGYSLRATKVTYNRKTSRLIANGSVKVTDPTGNVITAESVDVTDNFRDGFVSSLKMETVDKTYLSAEGAERTDGQRTVFRQAAYTACAPCVEDPTRPPLWQIKAAKIVVDEKEHVLTFENARLEFLGVPIAFVPVFWTPDSTVKRQTGFLTPRTVFSEPLGLGVQTPYFWNLSPHYDLTVSPSYFTRQGFMAEAEWRHRLASGSYGIAAAGIAQRDGAAFLSNPAGPPSQDDSGLFSQNELRGGLRTTGEFQFSPSWNYGWDVSLLSDRTFTRDYSVLNAEAGIIASQAHLSGLGERNFADLRLYQFTVTTDRMPDHIVPGDNAAYAQERQALVHPVADYSRFFDMPVLGGELSLRSNFASLSRGQSDGFDLTDGLNRIQPTGLTDGLNDHTRGPAGTFVRASSELNWQRQAIGPAGMVLTPFASLRGDAFALNSTDPNDQLLGLTGESGVLRAMPALGLEARWPFMTASIAGNSHVLEPIAQLIVRPDETYAGHLPNEDAQSLVFDDSTLFRRDKFSGFDRVEGGTRLNVGLKYVGQFSGGLSIEGLIGQSFQFAGLNSFAQNDLAGTTASLNALTNGTLTGLENARSDIVSRLSIDGGKGYRLNVRGRLDPLDLTINRGEIEAAGPIGPLTASTNLIYLRNLKSVSTGGTDSAYVLRGAASATLFDNWRGYGSALFDLQNGALVGESLGLAFDNECLTVSLAYNEVRALYSDLVPSKEIWLKLQLRTLGEGVISTDWAGKSH